MWFIKHVFEVIVNRLRSCMNSIIHDAQSVFVEDRLIIDNFMIAFEAFHSMQFGKINNGNYFAPKLDLSKAFDRLEHNYLEAAMKAMRVPSSLVELIMRCVRSVRFYILINGSPSTSIPQLGESVRETLFLLFIYYLC